MSEISNIIEKINVNINRFLTSEQAQRLGNKIELFIKERTLKGLDKDNKSFKPYSTRPFALPYASLPKYAAKRLYKTNQLSFFRRNGVLFVAVKSGYAKYKALRYAKTSYNGVVNLTLTGSMLRAFAVLDAKPNEIKIGFTRRNAAMVYYYNVMRGRDFLGIVASDLYGLFNEVVK